jgi:glycosyltransferase involved in cell wall biosynthesis
MSKKMPGKTPKKMKLLLMAHVRWYNAEVQYAMDLGCELAERGHEIDFFAQQGSPGADRARAAGLGVVEEHGFNAKGLKGLSALTATIRLIKRLKRERYDVVLVFRSEGFPFIGLACKCAGVPFVRVRGDMRQVFSDPFNRYLYGSAADGVVAVNSAIEAQIKSTIGPTRALEVIHGGIDEELFSDGGERYPLRSELALADDTMLVGILGRLDPIKGHPDFLEAARLVLKEGVKASFVLLVKNSQELDEELKAQIEGSELLKENVRILGQRDDLPAVLRNFDLAVIASVGSEANCRVGLEWMACGVPLLATRIGVLPDIVDEGETGFVIPAAAPSSMAEKIVYLANRPELAERLGHNARERVEGKFSLSITAERFEALLERIVN